MSVSFLLHRRRLLTLIGIAGAISAGAALANLGFSASSQCYFGYCDHSPHGFRMAVSFIFCASITAISAVISLGFSIEAALRATGTTRTMALYVCARSVALVIVSAVPFLTGSAAWLQAIAWSMIIVQACDAVIGTTIKNRMKTFGPAGTALLNLVSLIWLYQAAA